jgi:hypothetical protein
MKAYGGVDVQNVVFLTSAVVGAEWSTSPTGKAPPVPFQYTEVNLFVGRVTLRGCSTELNSKKEDSLRNV